MATDPARMHNYTTACSCHLYIFVMAVIVVLAMLTQCRGAITGVLVSLTLVYSVIVMLVSTVSAVEMKTTQNLEAEKATIPQIIVEQ